MKPHSFLPAVLALAIASSILIPWTIARRSQVLASPAREGRSELVPIKVRPTHGVADDCLKTLTASRWDAITEKFVPNKKIPEVSFLLHHLFNWGPEANFPDSPQALSGPKMLSILLAGDQASLYEPSTDLLYRGADGRPRLASSREPGSEGHPGQVLASFAALGLEGSRLISNRKVTASIAELVEVAKSDFHLEGEVEWTTMALASYSPSSRAWTNRWGRSFSFGSIAEHLLNIKLGQGSCAGTHSLYTLAFLLRVDASQNLFAPEVRSRIERHLRDATSRLESSQRTAGNWTPDWPYALGDRSYEVFDEQIYNEIALVQATGHHLEWLNIAPPNIEISPTARRKSIDWCIAALERVKVVDDAGLCPYSHCFRVVRRALANN